MAATVQKLMKMPELKCKAKDLGLKPGKMKKSALIHAVQIGEGYYPCYGTADGYCPQEHCCFRHDCLK